MQPETSSNVFVYGTLMFPDVQKAITGETLVFCDANLSGFRRGKLKDREYPGIIECSEGTVAGKVLLGVRAELLDLFDKYEGYEFRKVEASPILSAGERVEAIAYAWALAPDDVQEEDWDAIEFEREKLQNFVRYIIKDLTKI